MTIKFSLDFISYQHSGDAKKTYFAQYSAVVEDTPGIASWITIKNNKEIKKYTETTESKLYYFFIGFRFMWNPYVVILCI